MIRACGVPARHRPAGQGRRRLLGELQVDRCEQLGFESGLDNGPVAALGCSPAEVTWRAGIDVLSTVDVQHPELMLRTVDDAMAADVLVVGPGAGRSPSATSVSMFEIASCRSRSMALMPRP